MSRTTLKLPANKIATKVIDRKPNSPRTRWIANPDELLVSTADERSREYFQRSQRSESLTHSPRVAPPPMPAATANNPDEDSRTTGEKGRLPPAGRPQDKFSPSYAECRQTAKLLIRVTCAKLSSALETVARIYGYRNAHDMRTELAKQTYRGPYDDDHEAFWQSNEGQQRKLERLARTMRILAMDCPWLFIDSQGPAPHFIQSLQLFSTMPIQRAAFEQLKIKKISSEERLEVQGWILTLSLASVRNIR